MSNFYTVKEFASALGIRVETVYRLIKNGSIKCIRIGGVIRIPKKILEI